MCQFFLRFRHRFGAAAMAAICLSALWALLPFAPGHAASGPAAARKVFQDCPECPKMIVLPPGGFVMGSPASEELRSDQEGPQHRVDIAKPFAVAIYDVTRDEYARFAKETRRQSWPTCIVLTPERAEETGGADWRAPAYAQTGRSPAVCMGWDDVQSYIAWLNGKFRRAHPRNPAAKNGPYRLLTEAEWEYADRAGTTTRYYWGDDDSIACRFGNGADLAAHRIYHGLKTADCDDGYAATSPVGSFPPNPFGLYDMAGDVFQWVADCYHPNYVGAPVDGSAWMTGDCAEHVIRGGSLGHMPRLMRSAYRFKDPPEHHSIFLGFRLARDAG
jgi:formylglycine-generating enzyme required for sulfatase activity